MTVGTTHHVVEIKETRYFMNKFFLAGVPKSLKASGGQNEVKEATSQTSKVRSVFRVVWLNAPSGIF